LDAPVRASRTSIATAVSDVDTVHTVCIDYGETFSKIARDRTGFTLVTKVDLDAEGLERDVLEMVACPMLKLQTIRPQTSQTK